MPRGDRSPQPENLDFCESGHLGGSPPPKTYARRNLFRTKILVTSRNKKKHADTNKRRDHAQNRRTSAPDNANIGPNQRGTHTKTNNTNREMHPPTRETDAKTPPLSYTDPDPRPPLNTDRTHKKFSWKKKKVQSGHLVGFAPSGSAYGNPSANRPAWCRESPGMMSVAILWDVATIETEADYFCSQEILVQKIVDVFSGDRPGLGILTDVSAKGGWVGWWVDLSPHSRGHRDIIR